MLGEGCLDSRTACPLPSASQVAVGSALPASPGLLASPRRDRPRRGTTDRALLFLRD